MIIRICAVVTSLIMLCIPLSAAAQSSVKPVSPAYPEAQVRTFYAARMQSVVESTLVKREHPLPEIAQLLRELLDKVQKRYSKLPHVEFVPTHRPESPTIREASAVFDGVPIMLMVIPARMDQYYWWRGQGTAGHEEMFKTSIVIGIIHELQHLAYGMEYGDNVPSSNDALDREEVSIWALTCEKALRVFIENGYATTPEDRLYYDAWVAGGRTELSQSWNTFVRQTYAKTR